MGGMEGLLNRANFRVSNGQAIEKVLMENREIIQALEKISNQLGSSYTADIDGKLSEVSRKLSSSAYGGSVTEKLDKIINLLEKIERKL